MMHTPLKTCAVIGGLGFVGSALAAAARHAGYDLSIISRDTYARFRSRHFDLIINASGNAQRFRANRDPLFDFEASVAIIYHSLFDFSCAHYVLISTVDVYNDPANLCATHEDTPIDLLRLHHYGFHKRLAELCVMRHAPRWHIMRLAQMIGPGLRKGPIFDLLHGQPLWIHPNTSLHYAHTATIARAVLNLIACAPANTIFNVCGRGSVPFHRVLSLVPPNHRPHIRTAAECQTYCVHSDTALAYVSLPDSWNEIRAFLAQYFPASLTS